MSTPDAARTREVQDWLIATVAKTLEIPAFEIDVDASFERYGMDSSAAVHIVSQLEIWLGRKLPSNLAYQHSTIASLTRFIVSSESPADG